MLDECDLQQEVREKISGSTLFYPCSGHDLFVPLRLFSPWVTTFMFVDRGYFTPWSGDTRSYGFDVPADQIPPLLEKEPGYRLLDKHIRGPVSSPTGYRDIEPCLLTETYLHIETGRSIRVQRRRGYGFSAFRTEEIQSLGVFFYRGDSPGEGGSGDYWLGTDHVYEICEKLIDGGLIVTDGSQASGTEYKYLGGFAWAERKKLKKKRPIPQEDYVKEKKTFFDKSGRRFECIGRVGDRGGCTLLWQVSIPVQVADGSLRSETLPA